MQRGILTGGFIVLFLFGKPCFGQDYTNDAGSREKHFVYEVKQIDEFFERFNDDKDSFIRKVYESYKTKYNIKRAELIKTLFDYETNSWNVAIIDSFITAVSSKKKPLLLNFYGNDWYAEALCSFKYQSAEIDIPIVLKLYTDEKKGSKWIIEAVKHNSLPMENASSPLPVKDNQKFIHPASHSNNFIALGKALDDKENLSVYFDKTVLQENNAWTLYDAVLGNQVKFLYVKNITYHFLQITDWIFTVSSFPRKTLNSGWLIDSLKPASEAEKKKYRTSLLGK